MLEPHDVNIIGAGPAGLSAALVLARARRRIVVFDDHRPRNACARAIHGYLGHDGIAPAELRSRGEAELGRYGVRIHAQSIIEVQRCSAVDGQRPDQGFAVLTECGRREVGRKLLLATGMRDELPDIAGLKECYGPLQRWRLTGNCNGS